MSCKSMRSTQLIRANCVLKNSACVWLQIACNLTYHNTLSLEVGSKLSASTAGCGECFDISNCRWSAERLYLELFR